MKPIFLDYNATTPIAPSVQEAMLPFLAEYFALPDGLYPGGRAVDEALEDARGQVAHLLGSTPDEVVFCGSGTESCNLAIKGVALHFLTQGQPCHLVVSAIEHPAVLQSARFCQSLGCQITTVPVDRRGVVEVDALIDSLRADTRLVSLMLANDESGVLQPVAPLAAICRERQILFHTDACQAAGKVHVRPMELGVDLLSISAHKFYGPKGAAALFIRRGTPLQPLIHGLGNEHSLRAGAESVTAWIGMGKAANLVGRSIDAAAEKLIDLRNRLTDRLMAAISEPLHVHGAGAERLPNTLYINFPGVCGLEMLRRIPELSAATWANGPIGSGNSSHVLAAMQVPTDQRQGTLRLSTGWYTSQEEVDQAADLLIHAWQSLRV